MRLAIAATAMIVTLSSAAAQHQHAPTPYAGLQQRTIKALSDQQIADLRAGRGMGLALAAELNGFPGPVHVLELSERLALTGEQLSEVERMYAAMKAQTIPIGERLIEQETELDRHFATRTITPTSLAALMEKIASTQAALRTAHLSYHLAMLAVLTPEQIGRYGELRGYTAGGSPHGKHK